MNNSLLRPLFIVLLIVNVSCNGKTQEPQKSKAAQEDNTPFNVIFLVGDGMGLSQLSSAYFYGEKEPNFSRFPVIGLSKTKSGSHKITDSAAGATAYLGPAALVIGGAVAAGFVIAVHDSCLDIWNHVRGILDLVLSA